MHPAKSVIFFTVISGLGYGLAFWLGIYALRGFEMAPGWNTAALTLSGLCIVAGLVSSTLHLGHPERAWRAFSQWRTSWLSREGVVAVLTFVPMGAWWLGWLFQAQGGWLNWAILATMLGAIVTLICTAMIYGSLKAVTDWHTAWTPALYLSFGLYSGLLALITILILAGSNAGTLVFIALIVWGLALVAQEGYLWRAKRAVTSTASSATGLKGTVTKLEAPHSQRNYLLREMGFEIARVHAAKLRLIVRLLGFALPGMLLVVVYMGATPALAIIAFLSAMLGVFIHRWLFFAEARHAVMLFYGADRA